METERRVLTREELAEDLARLGLRAGDSVYVHTAMKRIGWLEGGPGTLIEAFLDVLGPEGTLAVPTHTLSLTGQPPYDPKESSTMLGKFPEAVWRDPRACRSGHASHSSAAIGAQAGFLTAGHDPCHALGYDSPLHRLYRSGGRILLLGVTHEANTALHLAESLSGVPYTKLPYDASWGTDTHAVAPGGGVVRHTQVEYPGCSGEFDRIRPHIPEGAAQTGKVGAADATLLEARPLLDATVELLRRQPDFFLCRAESCPCCPSRRALLREGKR